MSFNQTLTASDLIDSNTEAYLDNKNVAVVAPKTAEGIGGFVFDIPDGEEVTLQSDITDHYTESNSFLNDHIVIKPNIITLAGFIGELVYKPTPGEQKLQEIANRLTAVTGFLPELTPGMSQIANKASQIAVTAASSLNRAVNITKNIVGMFSGESSKNTKQQEAFNALYALWTAKELLTVMTPWQYFDNMVIQSIAFRQNGDSGYITDITVTLKEIRMATVKIVAYDNDLDPPRVQVQEGETEDQGIIRGTEEDKSSLYIIFAGGS